MIGYGYDGSNLLEQVKFNEIMTTYVQFVSVLCSICMQSPDYLYYSIVPPVPPVPHGIAGIPLISQPTINRVNDNRSIEYQFMHLLPECPPDVFLPVFTRTINEYTHIIQALGTMGLVTTALYKNKLYASCRDAENKKEGVVAIMSAYQAFLWDERKIDKIRRNVASDKCITLNNGIEGIIQHLVATPTVFNILLQIIVPFANADVLGMAAPIGEINAHDILLSRIAVAVAAGANAATLLNTFLVFSGFITSVFGVKTKSKPSKIISLGRTYLRLLIDSPPRPGPQPYLLFGLPIHIPDAPAVAPAVAVAAAAIDNGIVQEIPHGTHVNIVEGNEPGRLCLAYSSERIFGMAVNKYIKMDE